MAHRSLHCTEHMAFITDLVSPSSVIFWEGNCSREPFYTSPCCCYYLNLFALHRFAFSYERITFLYDLTSCSHPVCSEDKRQHHYKDAAGEFTCLQPKWKESEEEEEWGWEGESTEEEVAVPEVEAKVEVFIYLFKHLFQVIFYRSDSFHIWQSVMINKYWL